VPYPPHQAEAPWRLHVEEDDLGLVTTSSDKTIRLWDMRLSSWRRQACALANRNPSKLEWGQFIGPSRPYERTCPNLPVGGGVTTDE
jgi:hypothetical protein